MKALLVGASAASVLTGCAVLGAGPAPLDTYMLAAPIAPAPAPGRSNAQLLIAEPSALKALDGENIVIKTSPSSIQFLSGAQWADRLPRVVQSRLLEAFQGSGRRGAVGRPGDGLAIDYQLVVDIRSFEIRIDGADRAVVELHVRLLDDRNGVVRHSRLFSGTAPVAGSGNEAFVAALDRAFAQVAGEIVSWSASVV